MMKTVLLCVGSIGLLCLGRIRLDAQMTLPQSSLAAYIVELKTRIPGAGSEAFVEPSLEERESFVPCMQMMLLGDVGGAVACMTSLNYDLNYLTDSGFGKTYLVVEERSSGFKGLGTYIADPDYARNIVIAVP